MRTRPLFLSLTTLCLTLAGCGKNGVPTSPSNPQRDPNPSTPTLIVFNAGESPQLNEFQATHLSAGKPTFDFTFTANQDETLTLPLNLIKILPVGCDTSDIGVQFSLYRVGADGAIDTTGYDGLGESPVPVKRDGQYLARLTLFLAKSCLGIDFKFGIKVAATPSR